MNPTGKRPEIMPMALTSHSLPHACGYLATKSGEKCAKPAAAIDLMDAAVELGLAGLDIGIPFRDPDALERFGDALRERGLRLVVEFDNFVQRDIDAIRQCIEASSTLGASVMRVTMSGVVCGDRRNLGGSWAELMSAAGERLKVVLPIAEACRVCIAVENHQDATSEDLLRLAEMSGGSGAFGVTLDAGNPLAVGEDPVEYAKRIGPLLRHVHMKDYSIHFAPNGYRLVRCAAGDGVVDLPAIFDIIEASGNDVLPGIEMGAQPTRTIPVLEADWWDHYPPKACREFMAVLNILWAKGRPAAEPFSSAWERGEGSADVCAEEWDLVRRSAEYFRRLFRIRAESSGRMAAAN